MDLLKGDATGLVRIICFIDVIQPAIIILMKAWSIVVRSAPSDSDEYFYTEHNSSVVVILFAVVICFYVIHMTMALKLFGALELMELDPLLAARNAKSWQTWSIIFLISLIANLFANILFATAKLAIAFAAIAGMCEIVWRMFGIYNVGLFINEVVDKIPNSVNLVHTVQFCGVRFPVESETRDTDQP